MRNRFMLALMLAALAGSHAARATQPAARPAPALVVDGDVTKPLSLTSAALKSLPRTKVEVKTAKGTMNVYEGVLVGELLKGAGVPLGQMRGGVVASYAIASAADGYQAVFALAELDPAFTSNDIIVADVVDGKPLSERDGPLRLVAPKDLMASRSVRLLRRLQIVRLQK
jgi:DMSO/TMAO reductase YedYZ molybdopterin-dependent catalytic subunit